MAVTINDALRWAMSRLQQSDSPQLDAQVLLCHALDASRTTLMAWPERELSGQQESAFRSLVEKRQSGTPVAYLLGEREFWSLPLAVSADTLIPRPDTECLVEGALELLTDVPNPSIADLGTGTGAIALALASERPDARIVATDRSKDALSVAQANARSLGFQNVSFAAGDWCEALPVDVRFHLIISNPPYIRQDDPHLELGDVRFEPRSALVSGQFGLDDLRRIIQQADKYLADKGWLLLEHGYDQADDVCAMLRKSGYKKVATREDLGKNPRASFGQLNYNPSVSL